MSTSYLEKNTLVFVPGADKIGTMKRVLQVLLFLFCMGNCEPADPEFRRKAWENVTDSGFISHEYFQVVVSVPVPNQERPLLELREECRTRAVRKRDELSIELIRAQLTEERKFLVGVGVNPKVPGYETPPVHPQAVRTGGTSSTPGGAATIATQTIQAATPQNEESADRQKKENKKTEIVNADYLAYRASFSWLLDRLFLYKEDYSDQKRCTFVYRIVEADLLKRILESPITR